MTALLATIQNTTYLVAVFQYQQQAVDAARRLLPYFPEAQFRTTESPPVLPILSHHYQE